MGLGTNNRIFWPCEAVGFAKLGTTSYTAAHGLQSLSIDTNFNLQDFFEKGQIDIYQSREDIPEVSVTMEKIIDGYPLLYHLATRGASGLSLVNRSATRCSVALSIFGDVQDSASGTPNAQVTMSGLYLSSVSYTLPAQGPCTENVTLVGNNKVWASGSFTFSGSLFLNTDSPLALTSGLGGVQLRQNVLFEGNGGVFTLLPGGRDGGIFGISSSGTNNQNSTGFYNAHVQNITVSTDLGRDNLVELGHKTPFFRFANFPTDVTCAVEVLSTDGDFQDATESTSDNTSNKTIYIVLQDSTILDLGTKNKLVSVSYGGADANGGNATSTYNFRNKNFLTVSHSQMPG